MQKQIKVYLASKVCHAKRWLALRTEWPEVHITSRWPAFVAADHGEDETKISPNRAMQFWQDDLEDVRAADVVLVYAKELPTDLEGITQWEKLRGALVEAGMGLALDKRVIVVGDAPDYGTWQHHPLCLKVDDLEQARMALRLLLQTNTWDRKNLLDFLRSMKVPSDF